MARMLSFTDLDHCARARFFRNVVELGADGIAAAQFKESRLPHE